MKASLIKNQARAKPGTEKAQTTDELEATLGASFKALRLSKNISQRDLAERAGIGTTALKNLENGQGAKVVTLVRVARALGRESWLENAGPVATINPLTMVQNAQPRQRASPRKKPRAAKPAGKLDAALEPFLALLERDISQHPERLRPVTPDMVERADALVVGMKLNLDAALSPDDE